jgi:hypothetical protein
MKGLAILSQIAIASGILNVWLLRPAKATAWRGGQATTLREEFTVYGLGEWFMVTIGFFKILLATLLIVGIWVPQVTRPAALGMAILMVGAVAMHFKVRDPFKKSIPALTVFVLALGLAVY